MTDPTMHLIRDANPFPKELPAPPIDCVWTRIREGEQPDSRDWPQRTMSRRRSPGRWLPSLNHVFAIGSTVVVLAVVAAALSLLGHGRSHPGASAGRLPVIAQPSTRALVSELGILRQPQTAEARRWYASRLKHTHGVAIRHAIPGLTRLISLPHRSTLLLYVAPQTARGGAGGLGYDVTHPGGGSDACCIAASALMRPVGPGSDFTSGPNPHTVYHQLYWEIVPDGVTRVRWTFPRQPTYPDAPSTAPFMAPLTVDVPVHSNVAARWLPQRGRATVDTWYAADGHAIAGLHGTLPRNSPVVRSTGSLTALVSRFGVFRRPQTAIGTPPAAPRDLAGQRLSRYVPVTGAFGVWLSLGRNGACIEAPLAGVARPQIAAGGCNSHLADVEAGGLFIHESGVRGTKAPVFVGMVPDSTKSVTITLADGQVKQPTPHDNVFSISEPVGAKAPFTMLRIRSQSGRVTTWCRTCRNLR